jgi:xanthine dehydrogenase molybdopterin-binding subunit B
VHHFRSFFDTPEEIFTSGHVFHAGQTIGMIVAETEAISRKAAKAVKVTYKNHKELILVSFKATAIKLLFSKINKTKTLKHFLCADHWRCNGEGHD